jgi:hypothetical protein
MAPLVSQLLVLAAIVISVNGQGLSLDELIDQALPKSTETPPPGGRTDLKDVSFQHFALFAKLKLLFFWHHSARVASA